MILLAIIIILVAFFIFVKTTGFRYGNLVTYSVGIFLLLVAVTFIYVISQQNLEISSFGSILGAIKVYFSWLFHVFSNLGDLSGNAVNLDWSVESITNATK